MKDIKKWANSFESERQMSSETGLSRHVCSKLRSDKVEYFNVSTLNKVKLIHDVMGTAKDIRALLHMFRFGALTSSAKAMIKVMATSIVAKHFYVRTLGCKDRYNLTARLRMFDCVTSFVTELDKVERLLVAIYKKYPTKRELLFGGTGFIDLMKMYDENPDAVYHMRIRDVSPADSQCEEPNPEESTDENHHKT